MSKRTHTFLPALHMDEREDGRYDVTVFWDSSYNGSYDDKTGEFGDDTGNGPQSESAKAASEALDAWIKSQPKTFIVRPATCTHPASHFEPSLGEFYVCDTCAEIVDPPVDERPCVKAGVHQTGRRHCWQECPTYHDGE